MNVRINQGYVITDSIHIGKAEFVIGEMSNTPAPFVTWECKDGNNYFWGHYLTTRKAAERDLLERAVQELEYQTRRQAEMEPQDSPWGEIQTRETLCQHSRTWRRYGAPGTGGKGVPKGSAGVWLYGGSVALLRGGL